MSINISDKDAKMQNVLKQLTESLRNKTFVSTDYYKKAVPLIRQLGTNTGKQLTILNQLHTFVYQEKIEDLYDEIFELKACIYGAIDNYKQALHYFDKAIEIRSAKQLHQKLARSCSNAGNIYFLIGDKVTAASYFIKALKAVKRTDNLRLTSFVYNKLTAVYIKMRLLDKALYYSTESVSLLQETNNAFAATIYHERGNIFHKLQQYDKAIEALNLSIQFAKPTGKRNFLAKSQNLLAEVYFEQGDFTNALSCLDKAFEQQQEDISPSSKALYQLQRGDLLVKLQRFEKAAICLKSCISIMKTIGAHSTLDEAYKLLARASAGLGNHETAGYYYELSIEALHQSYDKQATQSLLEIETRFHVNQKERAIQQLNEQQEKLENINAELDAFVGKAAHDLKEPLRMISSFTQIINKKYQDKVAANDKIYFSFVNDASTRMTRLINDLLEFARSGNRKEATSDVNLNEVLSVVERNLLLKIQETATQITIKSLLPTVKAHFTEMLLVFQNLISNSIKFTATDVIPTIEIAYRENKLEHLITLKDNGIGIPPDKQEAIFEAFSRLHTRQEYAGSGLGLATCKKIIENNGGKIWIDSIEGVGTTFYFSLPKNV